MKNFLFAMLPLILSGCLNIEYTGKKFAPQEYVKCALDESEIPLDDYIRIGRFTVRPSLNPHPYTVEEAVLEESRLYGGDILLKTGQKQLIRSTYTDNSEEFGAPDPAERKISAEEKKRFGEPTALTSPVLDRKHQQVYYYDLYKKKSEVKRQLGY